jgi:leader peptidase (prepilin peptidase)/N-methyltransferase
VETALRAVFAAMLGLATGSFLSVVVHRVPRGESVVAPRSRCPSCGHQLGAIDNVPVVSYLILRGRCRACGVRISPRYLLLEVVTAALFVGAAVRFDRLYVAAVAAALFVVLVAVSAIDLERKIIPNRIVYPSLAALALLVVLGHLAGLGTDLVDAAIGFGAFGGGVLVVAVIAPSGMGMGDVKLAALIGLVLGSFGLRYVAVAAAGAVLCGGLGAIGAVVFRGANRKTTIPFGPFLALGAVVSAFFGAAIATWYTGLTAVGPR